jgi:hypothetical protein
LNNAKRYLQPKKTGHAGPRKNSPGKTSEMTSSSVIEMGIHEEKVFHQLGK